MSKENNGIDLIFKSTKQIAAEAEEFFRQSTTKNISLLRGFNALREKRQGMEIPEAHIPTGFIDLDVISGGGLPYGISVIGARPEIGLTDIGLNIALNASEAHKVAYFSPDISSEILMRRLICINSRISPRQIREGFFNEMDLEKLSRSVKK